MTLLNRCWSLIAVALALGGAAAESGQSNQRNYGRPIDTAQSRADLALQSAAGCVSAYAPASARKVLVARTSLPASFAVASQGQTGTPQEELAWQLAAIERCLIWAYSEGARQLVLGPWAVEEESSGLKLLRPTLTRCVSAADAELLLPRVLLGFVASALLDRVRLMANRD